MGYYLIGGTVLFGVLVFVHELGHFLCAKLFGVKVLRFSLGFPPTIPLEFNGIRSLIAIILLLLIGPLGGMVSIIYAVRIEPLKALRLG